MAEGDGGGESSGGGGGGGGSSGSSGTLPDFVSQCFYRYGLFVATHPFKNIFLAVITFLALCIPVWHLPLPGYLPQEYVTSLHNYSVPEAAQEGALKLNPSPTPTPLWYQGPPLAYIQQIVVRSGVVPWHTNLTISDAYRGPLSSVFHLAETIGNFQLDHNRSVTLGTECLLVEGVIKKMQTAGPVLPHYNCLVLSPADLWARNQQSFLQDAHVISTIDSLMGSYAGQTNVADILFGVPSQEIGCRKSRNPHRVITYAVTLALKQFSEEFIQGLTQELTSRYPVHQPCKHEDVITHIYFPSRLSLWEYLLMVFYCFLFSSIYFSILKIDMFKSKLGMAFSVLATLIASLCLSVGICAYFGLKPLHSKGKYLYPILAGLVGFENSMVLIRTVLSTPAHLDVKIRIAQGLAREGWTITKYFITMITLVTVSFFLFIPIVQEICIYGGVVLLCDIYMQLSFLLTVLSVDLHRYADTENHTRQNLANGSLYSVNPLFRYQYQMPNTNIKLLASQRGSSPVPNLHRRNAPLGVLTKHAGKDCVAHPHGKSYKNKEMPKRLKVTYFVARKRMFQRLFMCIFVGWIAWMVYSSGLIDHFTEPAGDPNRPRDLPSIIFSITNRSSYLYQSTFSSTSSQPHSARNATQSPLVLSTQSTTNLNSSQHQDALKTLKHRTRSLWRKLPHSHFPTLFGYYNKSLYGQYLSILPPIQLSLPVAPEEALSVHHPADPNNIPWPTADLDQLSDKSQLEDPDWLEDDAFVPSSTGELLLTAVLVIPALMCMVYAMVALYRCVCSRNYAEWRASWWGQDSARDETSQIIGDAMPLVLAGHPQDVECLCTDGTLLVSSCLAGIIRVWDPSTGECVTTIDRHIHGHADFRVGSPDQGDDTHSDYESGSPRSQPDFSHCYRRNHQDCERSRCSGVWLDEDESDCEATEQPESPKVKQPKGSSGQFSHFPDLTSTIDIHFNNKISTSPITTNHRTNNVFAKFEKHYQEHKRFLQDDELYKQRHVRKTSENLDGSPSSSVVTKSRMIRSPSYSENSHAYKCQRGHCRNLSAGSLPVSSFVGVNMVQSGGVFSVGGGGSRITLGGGGIGEDLPPIWCLECQDALIIVGCGSGRIEVWDLYNNVLKCMYDDGSGFGVTSMRMTGNRILVARLTGAVDLLRLEATNMTKDGTEPRATVKRTGHTRGSSGDWSSLGWTFSYEEDLRLVRYSGLRAHQQPINTMTCDHARLVTGSHDHTLKVFSLIDGSAMFTLHGHCGPITAVFIDGGIGGIDGDRGDVKVDLGVEAIIGSGSQDGMLCVWEVDTGACVYSVQAHDGALTTLTCTTSYILSLGADDKLCVWERFQGHLLNTLTMTQMYCSSMVMLTHKLLITSRQGSLTVWDITSGTPIRVVRLGDRDDSVFIRHMMPVGDAIVCDYGNQLRVVKLPVAEKLD